MKRPVKLGFASLKALSTMVLLGAVAHAGMPYLPQIGPPPLRVQPVYRPAATEVKFSAGAATNSMTAIEAKTSPAATNATKLAGSIVPAGPAPVFFASPEPSLEDTFTASVFTLPTPDLLGISPQMLATYFRPVQGGTNFAAVPGPFFISFMPPLPPDKSSHAEYIVK